MATPEEQLKSMLRNLEEKTGHAIAHWLGIVRTTGLEKHGAIVKMLKTDHGMTHGYANLVAHEARSSASVHQDQGDLVAGQYTGKEHLRPIYDTLAKAVAKFGSDVELSPKKAYVSLRRKKQFGLVQPSTKKRVDVGVQLKGRESSERLEASGSFNAMVSHRVRLAEVAEVDDELIGWLREAYDAAG